MVTLRSQSKRNPRNLAETARPIVHCKGSCNFFVMTEGKNAVQHACAFLYLHFFTIVELTQLTYISIFVMQILSSYMLWCRKDVWMKKTSKNWLESRPTLLCFQSGSKAPTFSPFHKPPINREHLAFFLWTMNGGLSYWITQILSMVCSTAGSGQVHQVA